MSKETFDVFGMTCAACQANVTKAVSRLPGVESADVSLIANTMKVDFDPARTSVQSIEQAVDQIGYKAVLQSSTTSETAPESAADKWEEKQKRILEEIAEKKSALIVSIVLLLILMCFSMLPMLGIFTVLMDMKWMMVSSIIQLVLCMVILFVQRSFFTHGFKALIHRAPNMDSLVAVGSAASFAYGLYGLLRMAYGYGIMDHEIIHSSMDALYFEGAAMIVTLVSLGKYLEARSKAKTGDALSKLVDLAPKTALVEKDGAVIEVDAGQVVSGDLVVIKPGMRIPVDGIVQSGYGYIDQSAITGESVPVEKQAGDPVMSATMNLNGSFKFQATKVGADTTLSQIIRLVEEAGSSKAPVARLADQVAGWFVPAVMGISLLTLIGWMIFGYGFSFALNCAISVLVISCPCALGLATPLAIMISTGKAAEYGVLIKSAEALEILHSIDTVVLDKTGTITSGKPALTSITMLDGADSVSEEQMLALAAAAESGSEHPLGKAIVQATMEKGLSIPEPASFTAVGGRGLRAVIGHDGIVAGNKAFMKEEGITLSAAQEKAVENAAAQGQTPILFALNDRLAAMFCVADAVRPASRQALQLLKNLGIRTVMLTGDNLVTAKAIAKDLSVDEVIADVLPAEKESVIRRLQEEGRKTAMVGDGINDAPALARADVGIAIGAGTDIAVDSADVVLMKDDLLDVVAAIELSKATIRNIKENLFWAFFYNCLGIPVAMGLFYPAFGWLLNPMLGAAAMSLSSVTVCLNALRLRLFKPSHMSGKQIQAMKEPKQEIDRDEEILEHAGILQIAKEEQEASHSLLIGVEGMSCSHCTSRVQQALEALPGVKSAEVSLNPEKALILYDASQDAASMEQAAFEAVRQAGYEPGTAPIGQPEEELPAKTAGSETTEVQQPQAPVEQWIIPVEGMSCSHCTSHVKQALEALPEVKSAQVTLNPPQAVVAVDAAEKPDDLKAQLAGAIEEAGYQPQTAEIHPLKEESSQAAPAVLRIPVEGMSCAHCTNSVQKALEAIPGVAQADVSLDSRDALVVSDGSLSAEDLEQKAAAAIEKAGYQPGKAQKAEESRPEKPAESSPKTAGHTIPFPWKKPETASGASSAEDAENAAEKAERF